MKRTDKKLLFAFVAGLVVATRLSAETIRTVAITGQPLPGVEPERFRGDLRLPVIDKYGQVSFSASFGGNELTSLNNNGMWSERGGSLVMIARAGQQAIDLASGVNFGSTSFPVFEPMFNSSGQAAFVGRVHGEGVNDFNNSGIWLDDGASKRLMLREGDAAVCAPAGVRYGGEYHFAFRDLHFSDAGQLSFIATIRGSSDPLVTEGIWTVRNGAVSMIARDGGRAPGTPSGVVFGSNSPDTPTTLSSTFSDLSLNSAGQTVFVGRLLGSGVTDANRGGIWIADADSVDLFMPAGSPAPGLAPGTNIAGFSTTAIDPEGSIAFQARLTGPGVTLGNESSIWSNRNGSLELFIRGGDPAPQISPSARFDRFNSSTLSLNAEGEMAFISSVEDTGITRANDTAIWNTSGSEIELVAREGSRAPGTPFGVHFADLGDDSGPAFNARGQSAFVARLTGSGVNSTNERGIWAEDLRGELHLIAREGDLLEVAPGDFRRMSFVSFLGQSGLVDGRGAGFNDLGQVVFHASFTDGTGGIFVSRLVEVPEPRGVWIALVGLVGVMCWPVTGRRNFHRRNGLRRKRCA